MFGNSNQNDANAHEDNMEDFGNSNSQQAMSAPNLPTMGGQGSPFGPDPNGANGSQQTPADPSHMISDHGTPDPAGPALADPNMPTPAPSGDLVNIKQQALQELSPLVSHLDQTAEEKFRTTMMMIQATDDQSLLKPAYDAAQKIEDDKARAQALLDVINEINYFTQQNK